MDDFIYKELSYKIMETVFEVHNTLGPGYPEDKYEKALCHEFCDRGINYEKQKLAKVIYKDEDLGDFKLDLLVKSY